MTLAIKQHTENGFYVLMEWDKTNVYHVMEEKKKAEATFRRYVKKYCKGE